MLDIILLVFIVLTTLAVLIMALSVLIAYATQSAYDALEGQNNDDN
jgi:hypothetical protein